MNRKSRLVSPFTLSCLSIAVCLLIAILPALSCKAQDPTEDPTAESIPNSDQNPLAESQSLLIPYQRVFLPKQSLDELRDRLRDYLPMDLVAFQDLMSRYRVEKEIREKFDRKPEIESLYLAARLDGPNLVSGPSRLRISRGSVTGESISVSPWSLAINQSKQIDPTKAPIGAESSESFQRLVSDTTINPIVRLHSSTVDTAINPVDVPFYWSLRNLPASKTSSLQFSFSIPRVQDACLLLALPPQAVVVGADVAVEKLTDFAVVRERLGDWASLAEFEVGRLQLANDSLWFIELSGVDRVRFSVSFDSTSNGASELPNRLEHLVLEQSIEHTIDPFGMSSVCKMEIPAGFSTDRGFRFKLPEPYRVRRLSLAGRELGWNVSDGYIVCTPEDLRRIPTSKDFSSLIRVEYSCLLSDLQTRSDSASTVPTEQASLLTLPTLSLENSYVMKGHTSLETSGDIQLTKINLDGSKLRSIESPDVLTAEWWGVPPAIQFSYHLNRSEPLYTATTRLTQTGDRLNARVRIQIPNSISVSTLNVETPVGWEVASVGEWNGQIIKTEELESRIRSTIAWDLADSRRFVELTLRSDAASSLETKWNSQWLTVNGLDVPHWLIVEALDNSWQWEGLTANQLVPATALTAEQRAILPNGEPPTIIKLGSHNIGVRRIPGLAAPGYRLEIEVRRIGLEMARVIYRYVSDDPPFQDELKLRLMGGSNPIWKGRFTLDESNPTQPPESFSLDRSHDEQQALPIPQHAAVRSFQVENDYSLREGRFKFEAPQLNESFAGNIVIMLPDEFVIASNRYSLMDYVSDGLQRISIPNDVGGIEIVEKQSSPQQAMRSPPAIKGSVDYFVDGRAWSRLSCRLEVSKGDQLNRTIQLPLEWRFAPESIRTSDDSIAALDQSESHAEVLSLRNLNRDNGDEPLVIEFVAHRNSPLKMPEMGRDWEIPTVSLLDSSGDKITLECRLLLPSSLPWQVVASGDENLIPTNTNPAIRRTSRIDSWWDAPDWWYDFSTWFTASPENREINPISLNETSKAGFGAMDGDWRIAATLSPFKSQTTIRLRNEYRSYQWHALGVVATAIAVFGLMRVSRWACVTACLLMIAAYYRLAIEGTQIEWIGCILSGSVIGIVLHHLRSITLQREIPRESRVPQSAIWDQRNSASMATKAIGLCLIFFSHGNFGRSQTESSSQSELPHEILFPFDSEKNSVVEQVFVPNELLSQLRGEATAGFYLVSAKHQLRFTTRGRNVEGVDQAVSSYVMVVQKTSNPIEIPFRSNQQTLSRVLINGREVTVSQRLSGSRETLVWSPDRDGIKTIQVFFSPKWPTRPPSLDPNNLADTMREIDLPILPSANAVLEVETDPSIQLEVESQGVVLDPASGRYVAQIGSTPNLKGQIRYQNSATMSSITSGRSPNSISFDIEMLLQSKSVIARSVLKIPAGDILEKKVVMEASNLWEPIGNQWGGMKLVETKPGQLQYRKRYVFEFLNGGRENAGDSEVSIYWGLRDRGNPETALLFAECIDPPVRPSTFRFARFSRSEWNIEQVNTWTPSINEPELLNWPELKSVKADQRATSLRIPQAGGGYLRKTPLTKNLKARIASRWMVHGDHQSLTSRIELSGSANTDLLELELPEGFRVEEVTNRSAPVRVLERQAGGVVVAQLIAERSSWENYDFTVRATRPDVPSRQRTQVPWLGMTNAQIAEQTVELASSENWTVNVLSQSSSEASFPGLGQATSLVSLSAGDQIQVTARATATKGVIGAQVIDTDTPEQFDLIVSGTFDVVAAGQQVIILQVPENLAEYWKCDSPVTVLACPVQGAKWLQIALASKSATDSTANWDLTFTSSQESLKQLTRSPSSLRIVNTQEVTANLDPYFAALDEFKNRAERDTASLGESASIGLWNWQSSNSQVTRIWKQVQQEPMELVVPDALQFERVLVNGRPIDAKRNESTVLIESGLPIGSWIEVEIQWEYSSSQNLRELIPSSIIEGQIIESQNFDDESNWLAGQLEQLLTIVQETSDKLPAKPKRGSVPYRHISFWADRLNQARQYNDAASRENSDASHEKVEECKQLLTNLSETFGISVQSTSEENSNAKVTLSDSNPTLQSTQWWISGLLSTLVFLGLIFVCDGTKRPLMTLSFVGLSVWYFTGWISVSLALLVLTGVIALDHIWIRRSNQSLIRAK